MKSDVVRKLIGYNIHEKKKKKKIVRIFVHETRNDKYYHRGNKYANGGRGTGRTILGVACDDTIVLRNNFARFCDREER